MNTPTDKPKVNARAEMVVSAPIDIIWKVLTEINSWPQWNSDVTRAQIDGRLMHGTKFRWKAGGFSLVSTIRTVQQNRCIEWTGRGLGVRAKHEWTLEPMRTGVRVKTEESLGGLLPLLMRGKMQKMLEDALARHIRSLKAEAERVSSRR